MTESTHNKCKRSLAKDNADHIANWEASSKKRLRLSLNKKSKPTPCERFSFLSSEEVEAAKQAIIPKNTKKCTDWSVRTFRSWLTQRNQRCASGDECPEDVLLTDNHELLRKWLCNFASELRKEDGSPYTTKHSPYLPRYSATLTTRSPSLFESSTPFSQCSSHCTSCLTDYTVTYTLKELEQRRSSQKSYLFLKRISSGRRIQSVLTLPRLFCSPCSITMQL